MFHVIIPARFAASRLPGKPLLLIEGRPLIQWVWQRAQESGAKSVRIATDDVRIRDAAAKFGAQCVMTSPEHASGTDRIAEVVRGCALPAEDVVVNLQGDEPMMPAPHIARVAAGVSGAADVDIATAVAPVTHLAQFLDPNCVKALRAEDGRALYFSRAPVPWPRDNVCDERPNSFAGAWRHIGIYAYRVHSLLKLAAWAPTPLELTEKLEHGMHIHLVTLAESPPAGVDTPQDLERIRSLLAATRSHRTQTPSN